MLIEYLGSFFSPYWGWDVPWEALIKVTETHTLWKHSLFIVAISFCSNTLTHYRAFLYRTIDPFLVSHYRTGGEINSLKFNTFSPPAWISRKGGGGGGCCLCFSPATGNRTNFSALLVEGNPVLQAVVLVISLVLCRGESVVFAHSFSLVFPFCNNKL